MFSVPFIDVTGDGWQLNSCVTGDMTAGASDSGGDYIQIWNPTDESYETWFYRSVSGGGSWRNPDKRTQKFEDVHEEGLPAGTAFWYFAQEGSGAPTFISPLKKATTTEE